MKSFNGEKYDYYKNLYLAKLPAGIDIHDAVQYVTLIPSDVQIMLRAMYDNDTSKHNEFHARVVKWIKILISVTGGHLTPEDFIKDV